MQKLGSPTTEDEAEEEETASSAMNSQSVASTISDSNSLTGAKSRLMDVVRFFGFQALSHHALSFLVPTFFVLDLVQTFTFALDPSFFYWSDTDRGATWAAATAPMKILRVLRYFHAFTEFNTVGYFVLCSCAFSQFIALATQTVLVWRGALGVRFMYTLLKSLCQAIAVGGPIAISVMVISFSQDPTTAMGAAFITISAVCLVLAVIEIVFTLCFISEIRPSWSKLALTSPRLRYPLFVAKFILVVFDALLNNHCMPGAPRGGITAYAAIVLVVFSAALVLHVFAQPFFSSLVNHIQAVALGATTFVGLLALVSTLCPANVGSILLIVAVVGAVPAGFGAIMLCRLRMRMVARRVRFITADTNPNEVSGKPFSNVLDVALATRFVYNAKHIAAAEINRAEAIFKVAVRQFRRSPLVHILFAVFLGEVRHDNTQLKRELLIARSLKPKFDTDYHIYALSSAAQGKELSDENDVDLMLAKLHHSAAKKAMTDFWAKVMRMRKGADPEPLLSTISTIDHHEQMAEAIFKRLLGENDKSVTALRAYAIFLQDIKDDREQAELLFQIADEIEDTAAKARRRREARRAAGQNPAAAREVRVTVVDAVQQDEAKPRAVSLAPLAQQVDHEEDTASERSCSTVESSAASAERSDARNKLLQYRARITSAKSATVKGLWFGILVSFATMFALVVVAFAVSVVDAENMKTQAALVSATGDTQHRLLESLMHTRLYGQNALAYTSRERLLEINDKLAASFKVMQSSDETWSSLSKKIPILRFAPGEMENTTDCVRWEENVTFVNGLQVAISMANELFLLVDNGTFALSSLRNTQTDRYLLDNVLDPIIPAFDEFISELVHASSLLQEEVNIALYTIFPIAVAVFLVCGVALFLPLLRKVNRERHIAANIFCEIPRTTAVNAHSVCAAENEKLEERYKSSRVAVGKRRESVVKQLTIAFWVVVSLLFLLIAAALLGLLFLSSQNSTTGEMTLDATRRYQAIVDLAFLTLEFTVKDRTTWPTDADMLVPFERSYTMFVNANDELRTTHLEASMSEEIAYMMYFRPCPAELRCSGLLEMLAIFVESSLAFSRLRSDLQTRDNYLFTRAFFSYTASHEWLQERLEADLEATTRAPENIKLIASLAFALGAVTMLAAYLTIRPLLRSLDVEMSRGFLLLLRLPLNVLTGVEEIRTFLETGFTEFQASSKGMAEEQEQRTKVILDGSKDAVVMMNESLDITLFNPAAEALLGYNSEDVLAQPFLQLLDERTREQFRSATEDFIKLRAKLAKRKHRKHRPESGSTKKSRRTASQFTWGDGLTDLQAICKDGTKVPVLISAVSAATGEGVHFAVFLKDIRTMKQHEAELQRERHRADILLKNILPEAIAETLKAHPDQTVAKLFESVTVLFADIVEFTPKAAGMTPEKLVKMLNGLFCRWDALCVEHGVEKIKTIGDCFMAACGVPVRCKDHAKRVVEFAVSMLAALEDYNRSRPGEPELKIRIGINTGSVVAGVIGKTKLQFDMWGDAVNTASRVESAGLPNRVQVSQSTYAVLKDVFPFESRGKIALKGKGEQELFVLVQEKMPRSKTLDVVLAAERAEASGAASKSTSVLSDLFDAPSTLLPSAAQRPGTSSIARS